MPARTSLPALFLALFGLPCGLFAAQLGTTAQAVLPASTRQVISLDYHRLASDPVAQQLENQLLPPQLAGLSELLSHGGIVPKTDLDRLTFATYQSPKGVGLIGVAEGNFGGLQLSKFFHPSPGQPNPPQVDGVDVYAYSGLSFFVPDASSLVFGSREAIQEAIATEQGGAKIAQNDQLANLISGTQSSDVWSVLDAQGSRTMVSSMLGGSIAGLDPSLFEKRFNGARYTIGFQQEVQLNLEMMTTDALSAAAVSTGLNAAIAVRAKQEKDPVARSLLNSVQVDSAGDHAFLQVASPEDSVLALMRTDLMRTALGRQ